MANNYTKCQGVQEMSKEDNICDIVNISRWLWNLIAEIMNCNCNERK